ncbi:hypothetical protein B0H14DRAFT_2601570 [Mycena olivaceomarginata]|nr:hypothetical protein B0H14DRAFT_2601570 [Mycena olivaceomarginata]
MERAYGSAVHLWAAQLRLGMRAAAGTGTGGRARAQREMRASMLLAAGREGGDVSAFHVSQGEEGKAGEALTAMSFPLGILVQSKEMSMHASDQCTSNTNFMVGLLTVPIVSYNSVQRSPLDPPFAHKDSEVQQHYIVYCLRQKRTRKTCREKEKESAHEKQWHIYREKQAQIAERNADRRRRHAVQKAKVEALQNKRDQWKAASARYYERHPELKEKKRVKMAEKRSLLPGWLTEITGPQSDWPGVDGIRRPSRSKGGVYGFNSCTRLDLTVWSYSRQQQQLGVFSEKPDLNLAPDNGRGQGLSH